MIRLCAFSDEAAKPIEGQIAAMKRNNIRLTELRSVNGVNVKKMSVAEAKEHQKALCDNGISVWAIGSPLGKVDITTDMDEYLETVKHICNLANVFETDKIRMFSFFNAYSERDKVIENLNLMIECAKTFGISLYHENEKDIYGDVPERVLELMDAFGGKMQFIFDPANYVQCDRDPLDVYPLLKDKIAYFHIKDARMDNKRVVPAGTGSGRIPQILKDYAQTHENTMLTLEPHLKAFAGLKDEVSIQYDEEAAYKDNNEAFDAGVAALKKILDEEGLSYE